MNLAIRDVRHNPGRFLLTAAGIGLLLMIVLGMSGIYRGLVEDAVLLVTRVGADLWVVQKNTHGPFAEVSRIPARLSDRVRVVPGVRTARGYVSFTIQRRLEDGRALRAVLQGLDWPDDFGGWLPVVEGRALSRAHYEIIVDRSLGLSLGSRLRLGKDTYEVVGIVRNMVSQGGDGMAFLSLRDALVVQGDLAGEAIRVERQARLGRSAAVDLARTQPALTARASGPVSGLPALAPPQIGAILVQAVTPGDVPRIREVIAGWPDVTVTSAAEQMDFLLTGSVDRARRQLGLFRALLIFVSGIIMALILYTLTLDKLHDIALLKLLGARNRVIFGLILQQAAMLGAIGYAVALALGRVVFPLFPRRVIVFESDLVILALSVVGISFAASGLGIWKALKVQPNEVLS